jgi:tetratricopeptide (TPR) repeat protein
MQRFVETFSFRTLFFRRVRAVLKMCRGGHGMLRFTAVLMLGVLMIKKEGCVRGAGSLPAAGCDQNGFDAAMAKAVRLVRSQDHSSALPCLEAAHAERQDNLMAALYLGEALLRTRSLARAVSVLQHVLALDARSLMARLLLATVRQQAGQKLEAAEEFTRALDIDPANVAALVNSGTILRDLGRETEALARFESAVRVSPSTPGTNSSHIYGDLR